MIKDIQEIFGSITPENIKNIPAVKDAMGIFMETLEDLSKESIDIKNIFENDKIREELSKIYLDDLYSVLKAVESNQKLIEAIDRVNKLYNPPGADPSSENYVSFLRRDAIANVSKYITNDHFLSFRSYKENKGKTQAIKYIYELLNIFTNNGIAELEFRVSEGQKPFHFNIESTLPKEFYEYIVYPLAHPMGFTYTYEQFMYLALEDFFPEMKIEYDVELLRTVCLKSNGDTSYDYYIVRDDKKEEYGQDDIVNRKLVDIKTSISQSGRTKEFYFDDGEYLKQITTNLGQTTVFLYNESGDLLKSYSDQCSVEIRYDQHVLTTVTDEESFTNKSYSRDEFGRGNSDQFGDIGAGVIGGGLIIGKSIPFGSIGTGLIGSGSSNNIVIGGGLSGASVIDREPMVTPENDLKLLSGKYIKPTTFIDGSNNIVTTPLIYNDTVNDEYIIIDSEITVETYNRENFGNEDYVAKEINISEYSFIATTGQVLKEPLVRNTENFVDYNGVDRGPQTPYIGVLGSGTLIGSGGIIGDSYNDNTVKLGKSLKIGDGNILGESNIATIDTIVNGEVANIAYNSKEIFSFKVLRDDQLLTDNNMSVV